MSTLVKVGEEKVVLKRNDDSQGGQKKQTFVSEEGMYSTKYYKSNWSGLIFSSSVV